MKTSCLILTTSLLLGSATQSCISSASNAFGKLASWGNSNMEEAGPMETRSIKVENIKSIEAATGIKLEYTQSPEITVVLTAPDNIIDDVAVEETNGKLDCRITTNRRVNKPITVTVSAPAVSGFDANSGASVTIANGLNIPAEEVSLTSSSGASLSAINIHAANTVTKSSSGASLSVKGLKTGTLKGNTSSGSSMQVYDITAAEVEASSSSGSRMKLSGESKEVNLSASSGASLSGKSLKAEEGKLKASSGGRVNGNITGRCDVSKSSGGSVSNSAD